ncbi:SIMPL domain-containing protein [Oxalobacteraceae bacterium A2-2]
MTFLKSLIAVAAVTAALGAHAAEGAATAGTLVIVPASGEVKRANDQAIATLAIEETDKDKAAAASRVNQKMKQGQEIVRKEDPQASLKTQGYYTYPVYPEEQPQPNQRGTPKPRVPTAWRVGQYLQVTTANIDKLPKTVAAAQRILTLNNLQFGLSPEATRQLDEQRIAVTYKTLNERVAAIARAMGRPVSDATVETIDFAGAGNYAHYAQEGGVMMARAAAAPMMKDSNAVEEPSFEPGETTLQMNVVGKVRFK